MGRKTAVAPDSMPLNKECKLKMLLANLKLNENRRSNEQIVIIFVREAADFCGFWSDKSIRQQHPENAEEPLSSCQKHTGCGLRCDGFLSGC